MEQNASKDALFGETGMVKGSSPRKYGTKAKGYKNLASPRDIKALHIEVDDASISRKRRLTTSDDHSQDELSPLTPLTPISPLLSTVKGSASSSRSKLEEPWSIETLGDLVWVRVNHLGQVFDMDDADEGDFIWWPAKNTGTARNEITASPYGTIGSSDSEIRVRNPSSHNILSLCDQLGRPRFNTSSASRSSASTPASPRKKLKRANSTMEANWQTAVFAILRAKEAEDDGLPPIEFALSDVSRFASSQGSSSESGKAKGKEKMAPYTDRLELDEVESDWDPPEPDEMLDIPGELVLARYKPDRNALYWPAKLLAYVAPVKPKGRSRPKEPKYRVLFLDEVEKELPRSWFYCCHESEFGTCQMGKFESSYVDNPEEDDADVVDASHNAPARSPSPVPLSSLTGNFNELSIHAQLGYIKPVLSAILNEKYSPAKERHDSFMKGGKSRAGLSVSAGLRGRIPPRDVERLQKCMFNWCLRDEAEWKGKIDWPNTAEGRQSLEHIDNAAAAAASKFITAGSNHTAKENIDPDDEGTGKSVLAKEQLTTLELRTSPTPTDVDLALSPRPTLPPSSSSASLLTEDNEDEVELLDDLGGQTLSPKTTGERPKGCPAYEALGSVEKINYCLNVLLPEAVLQLLLWRNGHRTSMELLSESEETELHTRAEELAEESDWVFDVVRLRETKVRQMRKSVESKMASTTSARDHRRRRRSGV